ncbi:diaminopimelate decarboxylase [Halalkalicoccus subterraneus]|uniref:diaminopimelate decarboxylase n=1 Tax=Halalkalicoccus subterraneus TaxID=2675002 RepID=UPI000EFAA5B7|nr:diaminopimelate decarboxylase [Halalkalicoccus subterraneus]
MNPPVRRLEEWDTARLAELAATHGTPLYVQDLERVRENYARMAEAFPEGRVMYAAKANTAAAVLRTLVEVGAGIECASAGEVERALAAGAPPERVQYTAVNPPEGDLDYAVETADEHPELTITAGAADTIDRLAERGFSGRLCLRVNPGVGAGHHEKVSTGANAKFGVPIERAPDLLVEADERGFDVVGIHAHAGSGISGEDLAAHRELVSRMGELARRTDLDLEFVDVGGGFGVPYREGEEPLDLQAVARATREALGEVEATLAVEPGRYLVADAGVLLTRINTVKSAGEELVVGVDAGMTTLARPAIYGAHHAIRSLAEGEGRDTVEATVTGPICESGDVFGEYELPVPVRDDLLAVGNAGAYGYEMASQYNSRPRPATVVVEGERSAVDRRRETVADVRRLDGGAPWL